MTDDAIDDLEARITQICVRYYRVPMTASTAISIRSEVEQEVSRLYAEGLCVRDIDGEPVGIQDVRISVRQMDQGRLDIKVGPSDEWLHAKTKARLEALPPPAPVEWVELTRSDYEAAIREAEERGAERSSQQANPG
jgi:hypothetical protein